MDVVSRGGSKEEEEGGGRSIGSCGIPAALCRAIACSRQSQDAAQLRCMAPGPSSDTTVLLSPEPPSRCCSPGKESARSGVTPAALFV